MNQHDVNFVADFLRDNFAQFSPVSQCLCLIKLPTTAQRISICIKIIMYFSACSTTIIVLQSKSKPYYLVLKVISFGRKTHTNALKHESKFAKQYYTHFTYESQKIVPAR